MLFSPFRFTNSLFILLALLAGAAIAGPAPAHAATTPCTTYASGGLFNPFDLSFEEVEYVNGFLVMHFAIQDWIQYPLSFTSKFYIMDDRCEQAARNHISGNFNVNPVSFSQITHRFSLRFTSPTHYELWNDETNTKETCEFCEGDLPEFPEYFEIMFGGSSSFAGFSSTSYRIEEDASDAPALPPEHTEETPAGCEPFHLAGSGFFFNNYERAVYQPNGLLAVHFRVSGENDTGIPWQSSVRLYDADCVIQNTIIPPGNPVGFFNPLIQNTALDHYERYYSIRFSSPTHYDLWNDETNTLLNCSGCSVDIPATLQSGDPISYLSFSGFLGSFQPTFTSTPFRIQQAPTLAECCSSIAFLPGIKASRLFDSHGYLKWEPTGDADVLALSMTADGQSANPEIHTKANGDGLIDEPFDNPLLGNVYKSFQSDLNTWKSEGIIEDFAVLPYDWRLAFDEVLAGGRVGDFENLYYDNLHHATGTPFIYQELRHLADESPTGKVTIVAHSMGGLLAKKLLADLEDTPNHPYRDLLGKIDMLILVASPQLGTPQTVGGLLHGIEEELDIPFIGWPNFAKAKTIRSIAQHMPSTYTLLPSKEYFNRVKDISPGGQELPHTSVVEYAWGASSITDYDTLRTYLIGVDRTQPSFDDLFSALKLKTTFIDDAQEMHDRLDTWVPPDLNHDNDPDFSVVQIAGWGLPETIKGIKYVTKTRRVSCPPLVVGTCTEPYVDHEPVWTVEGDGTVATPSAVAMGTTSDAVKKVSTWYVDLFGYNKLNVDRSHGGIFEVDSVRTLIKNLTLHISDPSAQLAFLTPDWSTLKPSHNNEKYIRLSLHSPVDINIYDTFGHHVGISTSSTPDQIVIDKDVSNSYYRQIGEGKYIGVPETGETYEVKLAGTGSGTFTFDIEETQGDQTVATTSWVGIPVATSSQATLSLSSVATVTTLALDIDGDGSPEVRLTPGNGLVEEDLLAILKGLVKTLNITQVKKDMLSKVLTKVERAVAAEDKCATKQKPNQIDRCEQKVKNKLGNALDLLTAKIQKLQKQGTLPPAEAGELITAINRVKGEVL